MKFAWLALTLTLVPGVARAGPEDALSPFAKRMYQEAAALEAKGDWSGAQMRYRTVYELDPTFAPVVLDLGRSGMALGHWWVTEELYLSYPYDADVVEALGRLYLDLGRSQEALEQFESLAALRLGWPEADRLAVLALAELDAVDARQRLGVYLGYSSVDPAEDPAIEAAIAVADALRRGGLRVEALSLMEELEARTDRVEQFDSFVELADRLDVELQAAHLVGARRVPLTVEQLGLLRELRRLLRARDLHGAETLLMGLSEQVPDHPAVWSARADLQEAKGEIGEAVASLRRASELEPLEAVHLVRLGDLLASHYAGRLDFEAMEAYGRAVRRKGPPKEAWFKKGEIEIRSGQVDRGVRSLETYLSLQETGALAARANRLVEDARRQAGHPDEPFQQPSHQVNILDQTLYAVGIATVYLRQRGDPERALAELAPVRQAHPELLEALDLEAEIRTELGEIELASALYRESLAIRTDARVALELSDLLRAAGSVDQANERFEEALGAGSPEAHMRQARTAWAQWRPFETRRWLSGVFSNVSSGALYDEAADLYEEVATWLFRVAASAVALLFAAVLTPVLVWRRRSRQIGLGDLLDIAPEVSGEVIARIAAIRHEVIKHGTAMLADAHSEDWDWVDERIHGENGVVKRFFEHIDALERLGSSAGLAVNLRTRDPVFGPLMMAMDEVAAVDGRKAPDPAALSQINIESYRALGELIRRTAVLRLDETLFEDLFRGIGGAPAMTTSADIEAGLVVRMTRGDFVDVFANLLRNAAAVSRDHDLVDLGVTVVEEVDDITGLTWAAIAVFDRAPDRITTQMIRSRYIERGLGIAVDLVNRAGGSIHVESAEAPWTKSVVVRIPTVESVEES